MNIKRKYPVVAVLMLGVFFTFASYYFVISHEDKVRKGNFDFHASHLISAIEIKIERDIEVIRSLGAFLDSSDTPSWIGFHRYTEMILPDHPDIQALEWIPRIKHEDREKMEILAQRAGYNRFKITKRECQGTMVPAPIKEEYYPVYYVEPLKGNEIAHGFDLSTNPIRLKALEKARDTASMSASGRITLVQETEGQYGFIMYMPLYGGDVPDTLAGRKAGLTGFALGVFRVGLLLESALEKFDTSGIEFYVFDVTDPENKNFLYTSASPARNNAPVFSGSRISDDKMGLYYSLDINITDRVWNFYCYPGEGLHGNHSSWWPFSILFGGLVVTAMVSLLLFRIIRQQEGICNLVIQLKDEIHKKKQAEKSLIENEKKFRTLFEKAGDAIFLIQYKGRERGKILSANRAAAEMHGYGLEEILTMTIMDIDSKEEALEIQEILGKDLKTRWLAAERLHRRKDGSVFPVSVSAGLVDFEDRPCILAYCRDITDRKKFQQRQELLAAGMDHAGECIQITDSDLKTVYVNAAFETITGYSHSEAVGQQPSVFITEEQDKSFYKTVWNTISSGRIWKGNIVNRKKDGTLYIEQSTISPIFDSKGRIKNYIAVKRDITEEVKREATAQQLQKMEAMGTLAGGIAHDFNNILCGIIGFTELTLLDSEKGSVIEENLNEIYTAAKRAGELVRQILAFSRQREDVLKPIQPGLIVKEIIKLLRSTLPSTIEIQHNIESRSMILGDPSKFHQIVMNLCTNAAYAMEEKNGILELELVEKKFDHDQIPEKLSLDPGIYLALVVRDNGSGIPREILDKVFDPYFSTKPEGEGTGLGLSVVHGIVRSYGGDITIASVIAQGTEVSVYLPVLEKSKKIFEEPQLEDLPRGDERILVVDDELSITKILKREFEHLGYKVEVRTSSIEALNLFKRRFNEFDLILTDMTMPGMRGDVLAEKLLTIRPDIPIILCTGYSKLISEEKASQIGIKAIEMKPLIRSRMAMTVRRVLDEAGTSIHDEPV